MFYLEKKESTISCWDESVSSYHCEKYNQSQPFKEVKIWTYDILYCGSSAYLGKFMTKDGLHCSHFFDANMGMYTPNLRTVIVTILISLAQSIVYPPFFSTQQCAPSIPSKPPISANVPHVIS
jgi:hypothetical protein